MRYVTVEGKESPLGEALSVDKPALEAGAATNSGKKPKPKAGTPPPATEAAP